ncbi:hypothetical protein RchiOBHm_Chr6g0272431 [Rosa chinensis]|uniref:Uncharacterized protein n=1 Tax=Rosa chinensis TaxID=74649 RepID=A0A2P6PRA6_ROSCH|nr:hypothetical protein RchiOBHm_Chr6g0272431 [Rosa chinensis]
MIEMVIIMCSLVVCFGPFSVIMLVLFSTFETHLLNPTVGGGNLTSSIQSLSGNARELLNVWLRIQAAKETVYKLSD